MTDHPINIRSARQAQTLKTSQTCAFGASRQDIRRYSMNWLLRAACRVSQRSITVQDKTRRQLRVLGVDGLFDLSDTGPAAPAPVAHSYTPRQVPPPLPHLLARSGSR